MYLEHFGFEDFPFTLTPNLNYFCELDSYKEALNLLLISLANGEGFIKITGEVGTGKTLLCRKLLHELNDEYVTAYISNPNLDSFNLQKAIARELEISFPDNIDQHGLLTILTENFIKFNREHKHVVIIVDEAHVLSDDSLDGLRLLSNLETETSKLIQIVLAGQPELDKRLAKPSMRQLKQRITFSYRLPTLTHKEFIVYLCHRLARAGYIRPAETLFTKKATKLIHKASRGIPRLINILCHKTLLISYGYNKNLISPKFVRIAIKDTESIAHKNIKNYFSKAAILETSVFVAIFALLGIGSYFLGNYITSRLLHL